MRTALDADYPLNMTFDFSALRDRETARMAARTPLDALFVSQSVQCRQGALRFSWGWENITAKTPPTSLLEQFIELQKDKDFVRFAARFGPLALRSTSADSEPSPELLRPQFGRRTTHTESLAAWRHHQARFHGLLAMAALARERRRGTYRDFGLAPPASVVAWMAADKDTKRVWAARLFRWTVHDMMQRCGVTPILDFGTNPRIVFQDNIASLGAGLSLFGALSVQLLSAASGSGFAVCSACGRAYVPERQPAHGRRRYCPPCRIDGAPIRDAKVAHRKRSWQKTTAG